MGLKSTARLLVKRGADLLAVNAKGKTPSGVALGKTRRWLVAQEREASAGGDDDSEVRDAPLPPGGDPDADGRGDDDGSQTWRTMAAEPGFEDDDDPGAGPTDFDLGDAEQMAGPSALESADVSVMINHETAYTTAPYHGIMALPRDGMGRPNAGCEFCLQRGGTEDSVGSFQPFALAVCPLHFLSSGARSGQRRGSAGRRPWIARLEVAANATRGAWEGGTGCTRLGCPPAPTASPSGIGRRLPLDGSIYRHSRGG